MQQNHEEVIAAQMEKIMALNTQIEDLDNQKEELTENFDSEKKQLEQQLVEKYRRKDDLEAKVKDLTSLITDLNVTHNYLQLNYEELDKAEQDLLVEQKSLQRKQQTKLAEMKQREFELEKLRQENEALMLKLAESQTRK